MSEDDPGAARAALAADAERLRHKRLTREAARLEAGAATVSNKADERNSVTSKGLRKALSPTWVLGLGVSALVVAGLALLGPNRENTGDSEDPTKEGRRQFSVVLTALGLAGVLHHLTATARARSWLNRLPFKVEGFDRTLGLGMAVRGAEVELVFSDTAPARDLVLELVRARLPEGSDVQLRGKRLLILGANLEVQANNAPVARWFRKVVNRVVRDVHRGYPIEHIALSTLETSDFHFGSGD